MPTDYATVPETVLNMATDTTTALTETVRYSASSSVTAATQIDLFTTTATVMASTQTVPQAVAVPAPEGKKLNAREDKDASVLHTQV